MAALPAGCEAGIALAEAGGGAAASVGGERAFHAASTIKLPILIEALRRIDAGELRREQPVALVNAFASLAGGAPFSLDPREDADPGLYARAGAAPLGELLERMITRSSNLATNLVLQLVPPEAVTATCARLGAPGVRALRGVEDAAAFARGWNNQADASGLVRLLLALAEGRTPLADEAIAVLLRQRLEGGLSRALPPGVRLAHKTGALASHAHDAGLLLRDGEPALAVAVLTRGFAAEEPARAWTGAAVAGALRALGVNR